MGVSRATVNSYLAEARARGIVRVSIDPSRLRDTEAAQALKQRFGLADCVVIPGHDGSSAAGRPPRRSGRERAAQSAAGRGYARRRLEQDRHGGGRPCRPPQSARPRRWSRRQGAPAPGVEFSPEHCAARLAAAIGARCITLTAPALVSSRAIRDLLVAEPVVRERLDLIRRADKLIFGICNMRRDSLVFTGGLVDRALCQALPVAAGDRCRGRTVHGPGGRSASRHRWTNA